MCQSTVLTQSFILAQCRKLTGLRSCALRVSIHRPPAKKGPEPYLLPQPSLRCETLPRASGRYSKYLGMCWPEACRHFKAYTFVFSKSSNSPSATSILGDCDWASGTMLAGRDILMSDNHLLRTFTWHISLSEDKVGSSLSIKQVLLPLAKSCLGYLRQLT